MSVSKFPQLSTKNPITGNTIFHEAAKAGSLELLYSIRDDMEEPYYSILKEKNNDGETCIHVTVKKHKGLLAINLVKVLVELGADLNAPHRFILNTALHFAVAKGDHELAEWLCQQPGIDLHAKDWDDTTALNYVYFYFEEDLRMLDILLAARDANDGNAEDSDNETSEKNE